ncbi:MAG: hypothetical protein ACC707_15185 [Thiohalomonadales bacterium]
MENQTPLLLIALVLSGFWVIGKILNRSYRSVKTVIATETRGTKIFPGFHITDIETPDIDILVNLLRSKDEDAVCIYLSKYRPIFVELDDFLDTLYEQFKRKLTKGYEFSTEHDKSSAISFLNLENGPDCIRFNTITQPMLRSLIEYRRHRKRALNRTFFEKFGDKDTMKNLQVYVHYQQDLPVTMHIPKNHEDRSALENLVASDLALKGRKIHLRDRLNVLTLNELTDMARELKIEKSFSDINTAANTLAEIPGSAVLLAMIHSVDDIFLVKSEPIDVVAINKEWSVMQAYSILLCRSLSEEQLSARNK